MTLTLTKEELIVFESHLDHWFYKCLNEVVPKMVKYNDPEDYRDACARFVKEYMITNPRPTLRRI